MNPPAAFALEPARTIRSPQTSPYTAVKVFGAGRSWPRTSAHSPMASTIHRERWAWSEASATTDAT